MSLPRFYHILREKQKDLLPVLILLIAGLVFIFNYQPDTWLSGWDTLHPEFNFGLYFKRILSFWQEHQGLGAPASQAHASELPRVLGLFILSFLLPSSFLRYSYFLLTLILGPLGVYFFVRKAVFNNENSLAAKVAAFIGSGFYLLNIGVVQHFCVPLEMFPTQFAFLGWLFLFAYLYLKERKQETLFLFCLVNFFSAPMAHTATLWYVYCFALLLFLGVYCFLNKNNRWVTIKTSAVLIFTALASNAFWLIPNLYFIFNYGKQITGSHIHSLFTPEAFYNSAEYGTFGDLALLKNFLFNWRVFDYEKAKFVKLLGVWEVHQAVLPARLIGWGFFGFVIWGVFWSFKKRNKTALSLLAIGLVAAFFWLNINPPLGKLFTWFINNVALFKEAFRFPFTKFSLFLIFVEAVLLSWGLKGIIGFFNKKRVVSFFFLFLFTGLILYYMLPAFQGQYISPQMRVSFPEEYFEFFKWFDDQELGRVGFLPANSMWGWHYYKWGYQGAGFLWFGLKQPLLVREFDRWHPANELFYHEFSQAIYSQDLDHLEAVLEKYSLNWLILDQNIIDIGNYKALYFDQAKRILAESSKVNLEKSFGKIEVYQVGLEAPVKDLVFLGQNLPLVRPNYDWNNKDLAFQEFGHYSTDNLRFIDDSSQAYYPFRSLFTGRKQAELEFEIEDQPDKIVFKSQPINNLENTDFQLIIPDLEREEAVYWTKELEAEKRAIPLVRIKADRVVVEVEKKSGYFSYNSKKDENFWQTEPKSCNPFNTGQMARKIIKENNQKKLRFKSVDSSNCLQLNLADFIQKKAYLVKVRAENLKGQSLLIRVVNETSKRPVIETKLPKKASQAGLNSYFVIPPQEPYGQGYTLNFDNIAIGRQETVNELSEIEVQPIPYHFLKEIKLASPQFNQKTATFIKPSLLKMSHPNPAFYQLELKPETLTPDTYLILSQAYVSGWTAWLGKPFLGKRLDQHVLINNWANGWQLPDDLAAQTDEPLIISLYFWPQTLTYLGLAILGAFVVYLIIRWRKNQS